MVTIRRTATSSAPIDLVWDVLTTSADWADWTDFSASVRERDGQDHPNGVGAIRQAWVAGVVQIREEVLTYEPDAAVYEYTVASGLPVKDYLGRVQLEATPEGGTSIEWSVSCKPFLPLPGADQLNGLAIRTAIGRVTKALARESARRVSTSGAAKAA